MSVKEYFEKLAQDGGFDEATKTALLKVLGEEKLLKPLSDGFLRQDDYSRNMDTLTKARTEFEAQQKSWRDWYATAVERDAAREEELTKLRGANPNPANPNPTPTTGLTKAEFEGLMAKERGALIAVTKAMGRISSRHAAEFHEALDVDAIEKIAIEKGVTVDAAYDLFVAPRIAAKATADVEARVKAAREEGAREERSKHHIPDDAATPRGHHLLFDRPKSTEQPTGDRQRLQNFTEAWNTQTAVKQ